MLVDVDGRVAVHEVAGAEIEHASVGLVAGVQLVDREVHLFQDVQHLTANIARGANDRDAILGWL